MKSENLKLYEIDKDYLLFLHNIDDNVSLEHPNANSRKFLGVVCEINNIKYYAPLGSPKEKHKTMHEGLDLYKIKNGELGVINFNNMIPVSDDVVSMFDLSILINDDPKYRNMMLEQLRIFNTTAETDKIIKKAKKLYKVRYKPYLPDNIKARCCDWHALEAAMKTRIAPTESKTFNLLKESLDEINKALTITTLTDNTDNK